jgi:glycerol transport system ATP-binding protein
MTLELRNVSKRVGAEEHIRDVSLTLKKGTLNVLLGPTLSGKTSLMRLMAGLDRPTQGDLLVDGTSVVGLPVQKRSVAMVYQQFINYPTLTVYENIASPMRVSRVDAAVIDRKVRNAAELLKLTPYLDRTPLHLSGGQQQRTAIARALVKDANLVLLDEPLANLDYKLREELRVELPKLFAESGAIFVYATTEPHEALLLGGQTATLSEGRVTQFGTTIEVYSRPSDLLTAQTFSDPPLNVVTMQKSGGHFSYDGKTIAAPAGARDLADGSYKVGIRPHHLMLHAPPREAIEVQARVSTTEITGSESFVHLEHGDSRWVALTHGVHRVEIGDHVPVYLDPAGFLVFDAADRLVAAPAEAAPLRSATGG